MSLHTQATAQRSESARPVSTSTPPPGSQDALVYAFALLLDAANTGLQTTQTKAKELNCSRSRVSQLIQRQKSLIDQVVPAKPNTYLTMEVTTQTYNGVVHQYHYFTLQTPTSGGDDYLIKNDDWVKKSQVHIHQHKGEAFYTTVMGGGPGTLPFGYAGPLPKTAYHSEGHTYFMIGGVQVWKSDYAGCDGHYLDYHSAYQKVGAKTFNVIIDQDQGIEKDRAFLTNKINILKLSQQRQETDISTTLDMEAQIIQQGMKLTNLLETLSSQIGQL